MPTRSPRARAGWKRAAQCRFTPTTKTRPCLGQGTLGLELAEQAPDIDTLLVAVGGGGLIAGLAAWYEGRIKVIGVEPIAAPTLKEGAGGWTPGRCRSGRCRGGLACTTPHRRPRVSHRREVRARCLARRRRCDREISDRRSGRRCGLPPSRAAPRPSPRSCQASTNPNVASASASS